MTGRYAQPAALRKALEDRLKQYSRQRGLPLDRVRKEAAFQRLLARIAAVAPPGSRTLGPASAAALDLGRDGEPPGDGTNSPAAALG